MSYTLNQKQDIPAQMVAIDRDRGGNAMSDVREELVRVMREGDGTLYRKQATTVADAILARFEVTPKPVVTDFKLGEMIQGMGLGIDGWQYPRFRGEAGRRMKEQLERAGLTIVRKEEGKG